MNKCKFCGAELLDESKFCSSCGAKIEEVPVYEGVVSSDTSANDSTTSAQPSGPSKRKPLNGGMLAWSIVNTVIGGIGCCTCLPVASTILGVIAVIYTIMAQDATSEEATKAKIRTATILNIIASAFVVVSIILFITLIVLGSYTSAPYSHFNINDFLQMYPSFE